MEITLDEIAGFVDRPSEGLNREIKRWIDPTTRAGIEKIVKSCFALRNRNGGYLLIGFDDSTLQPDVANAVPADIQATFHIDTIQGIILRYASEPFEIAVGFGDRDGQQYPVIKIADGVRSPVAVRRSLDNGSGRLLLSEGDVYFRTLSANGTASSAKRSGRIGQTSWRYASKTAKLILGVSSAATYLGKRAQPSVRRSCLRLQPSLQLLRFTIALVPCLPKGRGDFRRRWQNER